MLDTFFVSPSHQLEMGAQWKMDALTQKHVLMKKCAMEPFIGHVAVAEFKTPKESRMPRSEGCPSLLTDILSAKDDNQLVVNI